MRTTNGFPLGRSITNPQRQSGKNEETLGRRMSSLERMLSGFREETVTSLDKKQFRVLAKNYGAVAGSDQTTTTHPWAISLSQVGSVTTSNILEGKIYDGLHSITRIMPTLTEETVVADDLICLEYTYDGGTIQNIIVAEGDYEPFTDDGENPPVILTSVQHIAKIVEVDGELTVDQVSRNHFALTYACINGTTLKRFTAL